MKWTKTVMMIALVAAAAFGGGAFSHWLLSRTAACGEEEKDVPDVIAARAFKVLDADGKPVWPAP